MTDKERYKWYQSHGICGKCGQRSLVPGMKHCEECLYMFRMRYDPQKQAERVAKLKAERKEKGLCTQCGRPARPMRTTCIQCAERAKSCDHRRYLTQYVHVVKAKDICFAHNCQEKVVDGKRFCPKHLAEKRERMSKCFANVIRNKPSVSTASPFQGQTDAQAAAATALCTM